MTRARATSRLTALVAATALLSAAGLASGVLVGEANAAITTGALTPGAVSNAVATATNFTLTGSGFSPSSASVTLRPTKAGDEVVDFTSSSTPGTTVDTTNSTATALKFSATLTGAAPESYDVIVSQPALTLSGSESSTCVKCLIVTNPGRPTVTSVVGDTASGDGYLTITGTNFAKGAKVEFLKPDLTLDPQLAFTAGKDTTNAVTMQTTHTSGYPSSTTLKGLYKVLDASAVTAGLHYLRVTNTDNQVSKDVIEFWQPKVTSATTPHSPPIAANPAPAMIGGGADKAPLTLQGSGIRPGSSFSISQCTSSNGCVDITVGPATVAGDNNSITAPVSVVDTQASARSVTVRGPDGGLFSRANTVSITDAPYIYDPNDPFNADPTTPSTSPSSIGQGATTDVTVNGTFAPGVVFTFSDPLVTATTKSVAANGSSALITVKVDPNATVGGNNMTATNLDYGKYTTGNTGDPGDGFPFSVTAAPKITSVSPPTLPANGTPTNITLTGKGFDATNGMTVAFIPGANITVNSVTVNSATSTTVNITVAPAAAAGSRDITVTNKAPGNKGTSTCVGCFGINSLAISPAGGSNTDSSLDAVLSGVGSGSSSDLSGAVSAVLTKVGAPGLTIAGSFPTGSSSTARSTFDLTAAAPGAYNAVLTLKDGVTQLSCTGCFTISGAAFTITSLAPKQGAQGATKLPITVTGTNLTRGLIITIPDATVTDTTFVSSTKATAMVTIDRAAPLGKKTVSATNADGSSPNSLPNGFEIVAAPKVTGVSTPAADHKSIGEGASNIDVTVQGTGFTANDAVSFSGTGVTATTTFVPANGTTAAYLVAHVTVAGDAPTGLRDVVVTDSSTGGANDPNVDKITITVTAKPIVSGVAPASLKPGESAAVTISGARFSSDARPTIANVTLTSVQVSADGSTITANAAVASGAPGGARNVVVDNGDAGRGICSACFTVTAPTAAPTFTLGTNVIAAGQKTKVLVSGSPGDVVHVLVKGAASTSYTDIGSLTLNSAGASSKIISPSTTSSYAVRNSKSVSAARSLLVKAVQSLVVQVSGHTGIFTGHIAPSVVGRTVTVYFYKAGQHVATACSTKTTTGGQFKCQHTFTPGTYNTFAQTNADKYNAAGRSSLHTNAF